MKTHQWHKQYTRSDLSRIATQAMIDRGLEPEFSKAAKNQLNDLHNAANDSDELIADMSDLPWFSLDNDDSKDLDQLTLSKPHTDGSTTIYVAIADVDALIKKGSPIDEHASINTASVYTSVRIFPMLPEKLSNNLTSLNPDEDRLAVVTEMLIAPSGELKSSNVYRAKVRNHAKLAYDAVSTWIEGSGSIPEATTKAAEICSQIRTQDAVAQTLRRRRYEAGSLQFEIFQPKAIFEGDRVVKIEQQEQNRGRQLIEEFMIVTNQSTANFLKSRGVASLRRVVRNPERWTRIVNLAKSYGAQLPDQPDSLALSKFLTQRKAIDPMRFPDLSLVIVKLMGSGEYIVEKPGAEPIGHFGLAVQDYMHSTAPNRRYPDLITIRMIKNALYKQPSPYGDAELQELADHCSIQEDAVRKVERRVRKSEAALYLEPYIGTVFDGVITGLAPTNAWVRIFNPPAEGMLMTQGRPIDIGRKVKVRLISTDIELGYINFELA